MLAVPARTGAAKAGHSTRRGLRLHLPAALHPGRPSRIPPTMLTATVTDYMPEASSPAPVVDIDQTLARSAARGEVAEFESLYRRHVGRVHGVIARLVGHHGARAEDLTQETFVRAWQALPGYRFESAFGTWLYRLAANTALMELRARRSRPQADGDDGLDEIGT